MYGCFAVLVATALFPAPASSNGDGVGDASQAAERMQCATEAARSVQRHYESVRDLEAHFEQTTRSVALGTGAAATTGRSSGRVVFAKPGRMRWSYQQPQPSLGVSDDKMLWIYDPEAAEAQRLPVTQGYLTGAALSFLVGEGDLLAEYQVSAESCGGEGIELELIPRTDASYERLGLRVVRATGEVSATRIVDLFGNVTEVTFRNLRTNQDPPASTFGFEPPEGVRVIDLVQ